MDVSSVASPIISYFTRLPYIPGVRFDRIEGENRQSSLYKIVCWQQIDLLESALGAGVGSTPQGAFLKALLELGESSIRIRNKFKSRSGIAGGLFRSNVIQRAKAELIERDAFLYHYRVGVPFERYSWRMQSALERGLFAFRLKSAIRDFTITMILNVEALYSLQPHLEFATGCALTVSGSLRKALEEFHLVRDAIRRKGHNRVSRSIFDNHLVASFDERNVTRFRNLIENTNPALKLISQKPFLPRESLLSRQLNWRVEDLSSPIRFFRFCRVQCPDLVEMTFGQPESQESATARDLFHPFW